MALRLSRLTLCAASALAVASCFVAWGEFEGLPPVPAGWGYGVGYATPRVPSPLAWDGLRPPTLVRVVMVVGAAGLLLVSARRPRLAALLTAPVVVGVTALVGVGSPLPWLWQLPTSGLRLVPANGLWLALASALLAAVAALTGLTAHQPRGQRMLPVCPRE